MISIGSSANSQDVMKKKFISSVLMLTCTAVMIGCEFDDDCEEIVKVSRGRWLLINHCTGETNEYYPPVYPEDWSTIVLPPEPDPDPWPEVK